MKKVFEKSEIREVGGWRSKETLKMDTPGDLGSRFEKSLGLLTSKFVTLLQEAPDGLLDLKLVSEF